MRPLAAILWIGLAASAQTRPGAAFVQPVESIPGWYAVDGRVTPLVGAAADPLFLNWPDQRVRDFLDLITRSGGNLLVLTPPAELPAPEPTVTDPWLRLQRVLQWTGQRRIAVTFQTEGVGEAVVAKVREICEQHSHVITPARPPVVAAALEPFWRALLEGAPVAAISVWSMEGRSAVRAARMMGSFTPLWEYRPDDSLLLDRTSAPAYAAAKGQDSYLVYLPKGGTVSLAAAESPHAIVWICLENAELEGHARPTAGGIIPLAAPDSRHWLALVSK